MVLLLQVANTEYVAKKLEKETQSAKMMNTPVFYSTFTFYRATQENDRTCDGPQQKSPLCKEEGDRAKGWKFHFDFGNAQNYSVSELREFIQFYKKSLPIVKEVGDRTNEGRVYEILGKAYDRLGQCQEAKEYWGKRLSLAKEEGDRTGEKLAYGNLGEAYYSRGQFQEAVEYFKKLLSIAKEEGDRAGELRAYGNIGNAYDNLGQFQEAIEYNKKCLSIAQEVGDRAVEGMKNGNLGNTYHSLGQFKEAIEYHKKDLSIAKEVGNRAREGMAYGNLGNAYHSLGQVREAIEYHEKDLSIAKEVGNRAGEGMAYGNLGNAYHGLGQFREVIEYHERCLAIFKELGDRAGEGMAYSNLGNAYQSLGQFRDAIQYHKKSLTIAQKVGDKISEGRSYSSLGNAYHRLGQLEEAIEYHEKYLSCTKEVSDRAGEGKAYGNLGSAYRLLGQFQEAIEYHKKRLAIAEEVGDMVGRGRAYCNLGNVYDSLGQFQEAIEYHKKDLSIVKEVGDRAGEGIAYTNLGAAYRNMGQFKEAVECYKSSVLLFDLTRDSLQSEDAWKISFRDLYRTAYTSLWSCLVKLQKIEEALCAAEQGRAQALADDLKIQYGFPLIPAVSSEPKGIISYISNFFSAKPQWDLRNKVYMYESSSPTVFLGLEHKKINFWFISSKENKVEFRQKEIEGAHEDGITVLVETTLKKIGAGVGVKCENRSMDELHDGSSSNREGEREPTESSRCTMESLQPLHDAVIGPIADLCQEDELIVVPDGPLCLAPLAALSESIRIRTVPSLTSLKLITDSPEDYHMKNGALLVGDPCLEKVTKKTGKPMYSQLPNAKKEVEMIGEILKIPALTGTEATKRNVLEGIASVALVHMAAHGRKETGEIALAPNPGWENDHAPRSKSKVKVPKEEDYILKIADVQAVRLRAKLVVLSCCHSGRGEVKSEGVVGIARAFLAAGARSVLMSLWAIDDEATMEFMKTFYHHLTNGKSASVALHQAMKSLRDSEEFCDAKYWAPFVLIGDDVTLEFGE